MMMKRVFSFVAVMSLVVFISICSNVEAAGKPIQVRIDGEPVTFTDAQPFIDSNNRTMVPMRAIGEAMGLVVEWDEELKAVAFERMIAPYAEQYPYDIDEDGNIDAYLMSELIAFQIDNSQAHFYANWLGIEEEYTESIADVKYSVTMDTEPVIVNGRTYAPIRYLAEAFNYHVSWDQNTQTINLNYTMYGVNEDTYLYFQTEEERLYWVVFGDEKIKIASVNDVSATINGIKLDIREINKLLEVPDDIYEMIDAQDWVMVFETDNIFMSGVGSYRQSLIVEVEYEGEEVLIEVENYFPQDITQNEADNHEDEPKKPIHHSDGELV